MAVSLEVFWKAAVSSRLLSAQDCRPLWEAFTGETGATAAVDPTTLANWLVERSVITAYHAKILLAGHAGPFLFGDYRTDDRIDAGRLQGLFRARHMPTQHPVILAFLRGVGADDPRVVGALAGQALAAHAAAAETPHLSRTYTLADLGPYKFFVVESLEGTTLREAQAARPLALPDAARIGSQICLGLGRLHATGQAHGALAPSNVWLTKDRNGKSGPARLLEFPLAYDPLSPPPWQALTQRGATDEQGLADYLAPELARGGRSPDAASDAYSLGCLLYQLLGGRAPFPVAVVRDKLTAHQSQTPQSLEQVNPRVPAALGQLVASLMAKTPEARTPQLDSAAELLARHAGGPGRMIAPPSTEAAFERQLNTVAPPPVLSPAPPPSAFGTSSGGAATLVAPPPPPIMAGGLSAAPSVAGAAVATANQPTAAAFDPALDFLAGSPESATATAPTGRAYRKSNAYRGPIITVITLLLAVGSGIVAYKVLWKTWLHDRQERQTQIEIARAEEQRLNDPLKPALAPVEKKKKPPPRPHVAVDPVEALAIVPLDAPIWDSPTHGEPIDAKYLAPGVQAILAIRPHDLLAHPESEKLLDPRVTGTLAAWLNTELPKIAGTPVANMDSVVVGVGPGDEGLQLSLVVHTREPVVEDALVEAWGKPTKQKTGTGEQAATIYATEKRGYYLPPSDAGKTIVVAPLSDDPNDGLRAVLAAPNATPRLRRELGVLMRASDRQRLLTLLVAPSFFSTGGKSLFAGETERLRGPLNAFLLYGSHGTVPAASLSLHLTEGPSETAALFAELQLYNGFGDTPTETLAKDFRQRLGELPASMRTYVRDLHPSPYGYEVLFEFPRWLESLDEYTRAGVSDRRVVVRSMLPAVAANNLALGVHLSLLEQPTEVAATAGPSAKPRNAAEKLKKVTSLIFPRNTLEKAVELLSDDIETPIVILGPDLQLEGITKNQSFALDEQNKPAVAILKTILLKSNAAGKLVYVIKPNDKGEETIFITTRAAAAKRKETLPAGQEQK